MSISLINRRQFLTQVAGASAALAMPASSAFSQSAASGGMLTRTIPGTNEQIPLMGMGSPSVFYSEPPEGPGLARSIVQAMYDMGGRFIDTPAFLTGRAPGPRSPEEPDELFEGREYLPALGPVINELGLRDDLFLASKISVRGGKQEGIDHMDKLIANLNKRPMDLMMVLNLWNIETHWQTLKEAKAEGKVRYIGATLTNIRNVENFDRGPIEKFMREQRPDFFLLGYSMFQNEPEQRLLPLAQDLGIAIIVGEAFKTRSDGAYFSMTAGKELPEWAAEFDCNSWAQFALKYVASHPAVTTVITETRQVKHVIDNMGAGYGRLPDEAMRNRMLQHFETLV